MNMRHFQEEYDAYYFVADWHALTSNWQDTTTIPKFTEEMVLDWIAAGIDPERSTIYRQSDIPEVAELSLYFSFVTPMSWLERVPTYKEQRDNIKDKDLSNVGFFLYPNLMAADIAIMKPVGVPVGRDQEAHLELTREIVRRFNGTYGDVLVEPKGVYEKEAAKVPGLDGRKMSKSYGNSIFIADSPEDIKQKAMTCVTDPARVMKTDPGNPDICPLHQIHKLVADPAEIAEWEECCRNATCGCVAHKRKMGEDVAAYLEPFREKRAELDSKPGYAAEVLAAGAEKARELARVTIEECRAHMHLDFVECRNG